MSVENEYWFERLVLDGFDVEVGTFGNDIEIRVKKGLYNCSALAATEQDAVNLLFKGMHEMGMFNVSRPLQPWEQA